MDYYFNFPDLTDKLEHVKVFHRYKNQWYSIVARVEDKTFTQTNTTELPSILADLVDLASAIYIADWLSPRRKSCSHDIHINLPLRNPVLFSQTQNLGELSNLLHWYTQDRWHFEFCQRTKIGRLAERQPRLFQLYPVEERVETALWSGGLDSLAGLCNRINSQTAKRFTLLGSGSNLQIQGRQLEIVQHLRMVDPIRIKLIQIPIQWEYVAEKPRTNDIFRARGLVFKLLGAVCALLEGQQNLYIYENGFGALNLPFRLSEMGTSHTRSVHPLSLIRTGKFVSKLLGIKFCYENPYLYMTKAQMCEAVKDKTDIAFQTITCDSRHRQANQPSQCGYCSSCLLRRVALINALGYDHTEYILTHGTIRPSLECHRHFEAMQYQVMRLQEIFNSSNPWMHMLQRYSSLRQIVDHLSLDQGEASTVIEERFLQLYRCHVEEWCNAQATIEQSLYKAI